MVNPTELRAARAVVKRAKKVVAPKALGDLVSAPYTTSDGRQRIHVLIPAAGYDWAKDQAAEKNVSVYSLIVTHLVLILDTIRDRDDLATPQKWVRYGIPATAAQTVPGRYKH